jgi:hypothetical protein
MAVRRYAQRASSVEVEQLAKEAAGRIAVAVLAEHRIQEIPVSVDGAVEIAPVASDLHVGLVEIPGDAAAVTTLLAEPVRQGWKRSGPPLAHRLVRDGEASEEEQLRDVTEAELVAEAPEDRVEDDIGRVLELIEGRASALVEAPATGAADEPGVADGGGPRPLRCLG